jgi:hypothetical protein
LRLFAENRLRIAGERVIVADATPPDILVLNPQETPT